jgi:hypothetical protein
LSIKLIWQRKIIKKEIKNKFILNEQHEDEDEGDRDVIMTDYEPEHFLENEDPVDTIVYGINNIQVL